ncbi:adenylyltransferase/cytidyltransferase family protein [Candidatus Saccharibacteria bacterium]|nr:adenylyltransferase/cytidyltransferase family protein [Candidatus Saccharibacteria bacterium]
MDTLIIKKKQEKPTSKVGIFSGTFDPVHGGHIAFALEALQLAGLSSVYFLPEAVPRRKEGVTHYAHRIAMLRLALKPYKQLRMLELADKQFSVNKTLPKLKKRFEGKQLYLLTGSDMVEILESDKWPGSNRLLEAVTLIVGLRSGAEVRRMRIMINKLQPAALVVEPSRPHASSRDIRRALMSGKEHKELLASLKTYIALNWLYCSVVPNNS